MNTTIDLEQRYCAHNYHPLPVVLVKGQGPWVWDDAGKRYLDMMSAYSAVSHGHCHPRLLKVLTEQAARLTVVSRAFHTDKLAPLLEKICSMTGMDMALPMNTGAEAVETALKAARKWAYQVKGIADDQAEIIVCHGNFHGRTISIVGFSSETQYKHGFGPFPSGFKSVPFGDIDALAEAITHNTAAFLIEPIQGEGGIILPPAGYLAECARLCRENNVLLICDEIQCGLGRTGKLLASEHEGVKPDGLILGKALGGGMYPVSMFLARRDVMQVFTPGDHGSTFGGNPLAASVALEALKLLEEEFLVKAAAKMGDYFMQQLRALNSPMISDIRGKGLLIGVEFFADKIPARTVCEKLMDKGVLTKETHDTVVRFAPPLVIQHEQIDQTVQALAEVLAEF